MLEKRIPLKIYLLLIVLSVFNTEIITNSTDITGFFTNPIAWSSFIFYGFLLLIYIDLVDKFRFDGLEIFLLGLMHGIFEEGIALWTFFFKHPALPHSFPLGTAFGIYLDWAIITTLGEALLLVVLGILFARIVLPYEERGRALLSKKGIILTIAGVAATSLFYNFMAMKAYGRFPALLPYALTWFFLLLLGILLISYHKFLKARLHLFLNKKPHSKKLYFVLAFLVIIAYAISVNVVSNLNNPVGKMIIPAALFIFLGMPLCLVAWSDSEPSKTKLALVFIMFLAFFLIAFAATRTIQSNIAILIFAVLEIYLVLKAVRSSLRNGLSSLGNREISPVV